jgi:thioredoxin 1
MSEKIVQLSATNFKGEVLDSKVSVLVDFWAAWCAPCRMVTPILDELAEEYEGKIKIAKLNVDDNQEIAVKHNILSIPTLILFKDGEEQKRLVGALPKKKMIEELSPWLK